jgi:DNA-binding GntR family transcriptional regulator
MNALDKSKKARQVSAPVTPTASSCAAPLSAVDLANLITRDIQAGVFPVGAWLKQIDLEQRYGRNRNDIRRALERLAQMRVIAHVKNRGFHLYPADGREVNEILEIRVILETAAMDATVNHVSPADAARLEGLAHAFSEQAASGAMSDLHAANQAFHQALLQLCPNRELVALVESLRSRMASAPTTQWLNRARIEQSSREHVQMARLLAARDTVGLKALITAHILQNA